MSYIIGPGIEKLTMDSNPPLMPNADGSYPIPEPGDHEIVIKNAMLSMDAGTRMWLTDRTDGYQPPLETGTSTCSTSGHCSRISIPIEAWPAVIGGYSQVSIAVMPRSAATLSTVG